MKTAVQSAWQTETGVHLVTPSLKTEKASELALLGLHSTRNLIEFQIKDCTSELASIHLWKSFNEITEAIKVLEKL